MQRSVAHVTAIDNEQEAMKLSPNTLRFVSLLISLLELEVALLDDCDSQTIAKICQGRVLPDTIRSETWQVLLDVKDMPSTVDPWTEIYDLPEQNIIRQDVQRLVEHLGNEEEDRLSIISDLESIITTYSKARDESYQEDNGWMDILQHLVTLKLPGQQLYNIFVRIMSCYIPKLNHKKMSPSHIFRILLLYHEPELCSFLDTKKITPDMYAVSWFKSLFAAQCDLTVTLALWDICIQRSNPFFIFYLGLVLLVNLKENILSVKDDKKSDIIELLLNAPCSLEFNDVEDLCALAAHYAIHTPHSFSTDYCSLLFRDVTSNHESIDINDLSQVLCLPVSAKEIIEKQDQNKVEGVQYFVVDCRPADQYNSGHLLTAFHLDASLMLQDPNAYMTAVQALFAAQKQAIDAGSDAGGEHLCFVGSGREEEDQYIHMVIASFLQKNLKYISIVINGYIALHEELIDDLVNKIADHSPQCCMICSPDMASSTTDSDDFNFIDKSNSLIGKLSSAVKSKSAEVKTKLVEYITNPVAGGTPVERHVSRTDKVGKRYRNAVAPVFSIGEDPEDDDNYQLMDEESAEIINISIWLKKPDVVDSFQCHEVKKNGYMYLRQEVDDYTKKGIEYSFAHSKSTAILSVDNASHVLVTFTHLFILRELEDQKGYAQIVDRRPLSTIVKITSKRKHPELITFKYGFVDDEDGFKITDIDRQEKHIYTYLKTYKYLKIFLIPNAGEATKLIKQQIFKQMEKSENK
ncbi:TBC1 domain family member 23 [Nymphon striatum]|nr:TBC1 domain family member 23 [Nymphon striatum]